MPLYETIVVCRAGNSAKTKTLIRKVAKEIFDQKATLREVKVLGDRIMTTTYRGPDYRLYRVGRYLQFLYDSHDRTCPKVERIARNHNETFFTHTHRLDDYMKEALVYKRSASMLKPIVSEKQRNMEFLLALREFREGNPAEN